VAGTAGGIRRCRLSQPVIAAMIDALTLTREGRLAVLELKADEDIHLPLQGIDDWSRVAWHHERGEFQKFGYFAGRELSTGTPLLMMVAPALHVQPLPTLFFAIFRPKSNGCYWQTTSVGERNCE
jgi:hypothetical protein